MIERTAGEGLDEGQLAEAEAESDLLDADLEEYEEQPPRKLEEMPGAQLNDSDLAEADAEA